MIPKIIHSCWFGGYKTKLAEKCLASWLKFAPDFEIREHGEELLSENVPDFVREAMSQRKWAFVSDWARMKALYDEGGLYFDLDVELVAGIDDMREGEWCAGELRPGGRIMFNPGSGLALEKNSSVAKEMLQWYEKHELDDGIVIGDVLQNVIEKSKLKLEMLPPEVFSPIGPDGKMHRTENTRGIHWYAMSWASPQRKIARWLSWHGMGSVVRATVRFLHKF